MILKSLPHADVLVIGAGAAACGAVRALSARGLRAVMLERAQTCASEFADALYTEGNTWAYTPETEDCAAFREELCRRGILNEKGITLPAVAPVIASRLLESGAVLYAPVRIVDIAAEAAGYRVTFFTMGYTYAVTCGAIIDTTASCVSGLWTDAPRPAVRRELHINAAGEIPAGVKGFCGALEEEVYLSAPIADGNFDAAREALLAAVDGTGTRLILSPMTAAETPDCTGKTLADTLVWLPSTGFGTVVAAYDAGARLGASLKCGGAIAAVRPLTAKDEVNYDIIIAGGGTGGAIAALTAAREGGRVLLLEDGSCLGGMGTAGGVMGYYFGVAGGVYQEIDEKAAELNKHPSIVSMGRYGDLAKRMVLARALRAAGVNIRYESTAVEVLKDGNRVTGLCWRTPDGLCEAHAKFVIDATADGCVLIPAGAETMAGRDCDGAYQPFSNVYAHYSAEKGAFFRYTDNGVVATYDPAEMGWNIMHSGCDATQLKEDYSVGPRFLGCASRLGLREGQRIIGEETVYLKDLLAGRVSDQPLFWAYSNFDNHGKDNALEDSLCRRWNTAASMWSYNMTIPMPAGTMIPRGMDGLLVACRAFAVDHIVASAVRMKFDIQKCGEAAAVLAMEAIRRGCAAKDVPYEPLRERLMKTNCLNSETVPSVVCIDPARTATVMGQGDLWTNDIELIRREMTGTFQGYAIWSAAVHGVELHDTLVQWLSSDEQKLRWHAALALGLAGCEGAKYDEAIPHLLEMAQDKSGETIMGGRKYNYPYALSAAVLLDLLGVREGVDVLLPLVADPAYAAEIPFEPCELTEDREDMIYQYTLQGFSALCGLYRRFPEERARIAAAMDSRLGAEDFHLSVTGKAANTVRIDYTAKVRALWEKCRGEN